MRAATEGHLPPFMLQGNLVEVLGRELRQGSPGELMVESSPSRRRRPSCKTNKEMSGEAADAAALTYLLTYLLIHGENISHVWNSCFLLHFTVLWAWRHTSLTEHIERKTPRGSVSGCCLVIKITKRFTKTFKLKTLS